MKTCSGCKGTTSLVTIRMRIAGRNVAFHSCSACESKIWVDDTGTVALADLLAFAREHGRDLAGPRRFRGQRDRVREVAGRAETHH